MGSGFDGLRDRFAVPITCAGCGQVGSVTWEEARTPTGGAIGAATLISVSNGFHTGDSANSYGTQRIICDHCGTEQSD
jgi:hypothetical protein